MSRPWLWITTDTPRRLALVRGPDAYQVCCQFSPAGVPPVRSTAGGWVVALDVAGDIATYAEYAHRFIVVTERKRARR